MDSEVNMYHKIKIVKYTTTDYSDNYDYVTEIVHKTISESEWYTVTDEEYKDLVRTIGYLRNRGIGNEEKYLLVKRENMDEFRKDIEFFKEELNKIKKRELEREKKEKETEEKRKQRALVSEKNKEKRRIEKIKKEAEKLGLKVE